ncbi:unnamed protein product, partial [Notodromas monacha]
ELPTIEDLANASQDKVLSLWQGLGYYSRAINLHQCAQDIVFNRQGEFPSEKSELKTLKGVGEYIASAIASMAFDQICVAMDGNAYRVYSRYLGVDTPINSPSTIRLLTQKAQDLIDIKRPGDFNQAIMDLGA